MLEAGKKFRVLWRRWNIPFRLGATPLRNWG
jgi:hypothetical protein